MSARSSTVGRPHLRLGAALTALVLAIALVAFPATSAAQEEGVCLQFDTELVSLNLTGGPFPMPLAADPTNARSDSVDGYGFVDSAVTVTLSSQRATSPGPPSTGEAFAFNDFQGDGQGGPCGEGEIDPDALDGQQFIVDSFFDVFFDITVTDVDSRPGRDYAGAPDGAAFTLPDNGPANMESFARGVVFDKDAPNFGLIPPPEADPYIGHFLIEIPLGGDINGNGENDKIKFTLATHSAGDTNRTFIQLPDGTVIDGFNSAAFLAGAIVDESSDPPFMIGALLPSGLPDADAFGGPTTATSTLLNPVVPARDHYLFYDVKRSKHSPKFEKTAVHLADQFQSGMFIVEKPKWFANPVSKNDEPIFNEATHMTSYKIKRAPDQPEFSPVSRVGVVNQFHEEPLLVDVIKPDRLLVPGVKSLDAEPTDIPDGFPVDHYTCYKTEMTEGFEFPEGIEVTLTDQFTEFKWFEVKGPTRLCAPTKKTTADGAETVIQHPGAHLMCYKLKSVKGELKHEKLKGFWAGDQFGLHQFDSKKEVELCVPSRKILP